MRTKTKTTESDLLKQIKATLEVLKAQGLISYRRIHVMPVFRKGRMSKNPDQCGMEDIQVYLMGGRTLYWELKSPTGKQSEHQKQRQEELTNLGHDYKVIRSLEQALSELGAKGLSVLTLEASW
ncbi:hypothetical protein EBZ39_08415 [bacterium]|nr:hypothetical protein [bacterium]